MRVRVLVVNRLLLQLVLKNLAKVNIISMTDIGRVEMVLMMMMLLLMMMMMVLTTMFVGKRIKWMKVLMVKLSMNKRMWIHLMTQ